jgi:hypothetical protein
MNTLAKRLRKNIQRNQLLDRELDYLPATINRDEVRLLARKYGPSRRRSLVGKTIAGASGFVLRYGAPFIGMILGAEFRAMKALAPLIGKEERFGDSLRMFLGEGLAKKVDDTNKMMKMTGAMVSATPEIFLWAFYGAVWGVVVYYILRWSLMLAIGNHRKRKLYKKIKLLGD